MTDLPKGPVKVEVGATAKLGFEVKTEIPSEATGRFVDTITKILSPWAEGRALKADLIRLHRENVAFEIARRASERLEFQRSNAQPIPLKILVPLLERGSQEDLKDDTMIEMWARLLSSAAIVPDISPRYISILADMTANEARLLTTITRGKVYLDAGCTDTRVRAPNALLETVKDETFEQIEAELRGYFSYDRTYLSSALFSLQDGPKDRIGPSVGDPIVEGSPFHSLNILQSLHLLNGGYGTRVVDGRFIKRLTLWWYETTSFANSFMDCVMPEHPNYE